MIKIIKNVYDSKIIKNEYDSKIIKNAYDSKIGVGLMKLDQRLNWHKVQQINFAQEPSSVLLIKSYCPYEKATGFLRGWSITCIGA